ncbi:Shikimate dehydrogenase (NADP(+)) [Candidatus Ecksteinia adelgidicola]|nr:Shikimate dehydrogenase (NADP(+)) [Candidatus Ecksteinia adelgidicola]
MKKFALFGNPISHSQSPLIHSLFSNQTKIDYKYHTILTPIHSFEIFLKKFFHDNGQGANITLPFKERAFKITSHLTKRATLSCAVNTFKILSTGDLLGDNTDGIGLLSDLQYQKLIHRKDRVLLIGAGGAARGVIFPLLSFGCQLIITNRTFSRAKELVRIFKNFGDISICSINELHKQSFNLIINATSSGINGSIPILPSNIINDHTRLYDMYYQRGTTPFLIWGKKKGSKIFSDGLGMLIHQAAHSFFLWHGIMPKIKPVLNYLQNYFIK